MKKLALLGSTGSIGCSTLDVVRNNPNKFKIVAMSCGSNLDLFASQIKEFKPELVSLKDENDIKLLQEKLGSFKLAIEHGIEGNIFVATHPEVTMVISAIVGAAGLRPTYEAILAGKDIGLANKETLVVAGELMSKLAQQKKIKILPIDSEHSAIFQCLQGQDNKALRKIMVTASGGPFLHKPRDEFNFITKTMALKHPNWTMGAKITIDSATLMNKGLEVIEAKWLFDLMESQIEVLVHPQSIIHSMVEYHDGSVLAQLGIPDMRVPIAYAMSYPERLPNPLPSLSLIEVGQLTFFAPDYEKFPCLRLARECLQQGGSTFAVLNAANEIAVEYFLKEKINFINIAHVVQETLSIHNKIHLPDVASVIEVDAWARRQAKELILNL